MPDNAIARDVDADRSAGGTQSIQRAVLILRLLTRRGREGSRLGDLTKMSGLPHPTIRRMLKCLIDERLVVQDPDTKRYQLGPLNFELGLASEHRLDFRTTLRPVLERIARLTGDTLYLSLHSGVETVCIDRIEGSSPIRAITLEIGGRRPLGFGSAGLALLARMSQAEVDEILDVIAPEIESNPRMSREALVRAIEQTRERGYGIIRDTTVLGVSAIGVALPERDNLPRLAIGLAMVNERLSPSRAKSLHTLMREELDRI